MKLVGADGTAAAEASAGEELPNRLDFTTQLNPGLSKRGIIIFDVRPQQYALELSGGYESDARALVALPFPGRADAAPSPDEEQQPDSSQPASPLSSASATSTIPESPVIRRSDGIPFRIVNGERIRADMPNLCDTPDPVLGLPGVCKLGKSSPSAPEKNENAAIQPPASGGGSPNQPESEDQFVFDLTNTLAAMTTADRHTIEPIARREFTRCHELGFSTEPQMNDCILNHPSAEMVDLPRGSF